MHMDARSRKHSEITQTVYDLPPIFTCVIATENRALAPDEWDVADRATQRAAAAAAAATHPRESECTLPTTTRPASEPSSVHAPNTLPPA
jgi:sarcosine oxidase gamma subunit